MKITKTAQFNSHKAQIFLEYFKSTIRFEGGMILGTGNLSARFNENEQLETTINCILEFRNNKKVSMDWVIVQNADQTIPYFEAVLNDSSISQTEFEVEIERFINNVLFKSHADQSSIFFYRFQFGFLNNRNIEGEYWFANIDFKGSKVRISPIFTEDRVSFSMNTEQLIAIDIEVQAVDQTNGYEKAYTLTNRFVALLSFILDIGLYKHNIEHRYFAYTTDEIGLKTVYKKGFTNFRDPHSQILTKMPLKSQYSKLGKFEGTLTDNIGRFRQDLKFPTNSKKIIKFIQECDPILKNTIINASQLYQLALTFGRYYPTVKAAYFYACIDCITKMPESKIKKFTEFVKFHNPTVDKNILKIMSDSRSAHWHAGEFKLGENNYTFDTLLDYKHNYNKFLELEIYATTRQTLNNWLESLMKTN